MMKIVSIVSFLLLYALNSFAQRPHIEVLSTAVRDSLADTYIAVKSYSFKIYDSSIGEMHHEYGYVNLYLGSNGRYALNLTENTSSGYCGTSFAHRMSSGIFSYSKDTLILSDEKLNYQMRFLRRKKKLHPVNSFRLIGAMADSHIGSINLINLLPANMSFAEENCPDLEAIKDDITGKYYSGAYTLEFSENDFHLYYRNRLVLDGSWEWRNSKIVAHCTTIGTDLIFVLNKGKMLTAERFIDNTCRFYSTLYGYGK